MFAPGFGNQRLRFLRLLPFNICGLLMPGFCLEPLTPGDNPYIILSDGHSNHCRTHRTE